MDAPTASPASPIPANAAGTTATALALRGSPYREGGDNPDGFDCSGFTRYVFARHNIALPRLAADQCHAGTAVSRNELVAEDLVFFETIAPESSHVGVAIGIEAFVHAPGSRGEVRVEPLSSSYWAKRCVGARRIVE